nr:GFA family protein [Tichowtungia aerotolerans]
MANCHCKSCKKTSGSMFSAIVGVSEPTFALKGNTLTSYVSRGDSGKPIHRNFCSNCGTPIFSKAENSPGILYLRAGTIDNEFDFSPKANIYWRDHKDWLPKDIPSFETMPSIK